MHNVLFVSLTRTRLLFIVIPSFIVPNVFGVVAFVERVELVRVRASDAYYFTWRHVLSKSHMLLCMLIRAKIRDTRFSHVYASRHDV